MNDPVFFEAAQVLAARILKEVPGSVSDRIDYAFKLCLARAPRPQEKDRLLNYYRQQKEILAEEPESIDTVFPAKNLERVNAAEAAA